MEETLRIGPWNMDAYSKCLVRHQFSEIDHIGVYVIIVDDFGNEYGGHPDITYVLTSFFVAIERKHGGFF